MNKISRSFHANKRGNRAQRRRARSQVHIYYRHDGTDPALARAIQANTEVMDVVTADDREWFAANPDRCYRLRLSSDPERAISGTCNYIVIKQVRPGVRVRVGIKAHPFHRPEHFGDNACARLFAQAEKVSPPDFVKALKMMERL